MKTIKIEKKGEYLVITDVLDKELCTINKEGGIITKNALSIHPEELKQMFVISHNFWLFFNNIK